MQLLSAIRECPALAATRFYMALASLSLARHELLWYFTHQHFLATQPPNKELKVRLVYLFVGFPIDWGGGSRLHFAIAVCPSHVWSISLFHVYIFVSLASESGRPALLFFSL